MFLFIDAKPETNQPSSSLTVKEAAANLSLKGRFGDIETENRPNIPYDFLK